MLAHYMISVISIAAHPADPLALSRDAVISPLSLSDAAWETRRQAGRHCPPQFMQVARRPTNFRRKAEVPRERPMLIDPAGEDAKFHSLWRRV